MTHARNTKCRNMETIKHWNFVEIVKFGRFCRDLYCLIWKFGQSSESKFEPSITTVNEWVSKVGVELVSSGEVKIGCNQRSRFLPFQYKSGFQNPDSGSLDVFFYDSFPCLAFKPCYHFSNPKMFPRLSNGEERMDSTRWRDDIKLWPRSHNNR